MGGAPQRRRLFEGELREHELAEFPLRGPFGGIQSEVPLDSIEQLGFDDCYNMMLRKGKATVRPSYETLVSMPSTQEEINGIADFFDATGNRLQVIMTPDRLLQWDGATPQWVLVDKAGAGDLTGAVTDIFDWTVVANKLLFCQGVDKVQVWDGITATHDDVDATAVPAKYLMELGFHLVVGDTIESGNRAPQRVRWTAAGDPTDWTGFNAGQVDLFNDLGPINGLVKLFQNGYAMQQWGITQIIPTGFGLAPFDFRPMSAHSKGNIAPYSLAAFGEQLACYVGKDNIYLFNGTESIPIGDAPIEGTFVKRGAKRRIMAELLQANLDLVYGFLSTSIDGNDYLSYWLNIPTGSTWVYHFDEACWTRFQFNKVPRTMGRFNAEIGIRIIDLVGTIAEQSWTPATLQGTNPLDSMLIGFTDATPGRLDFSTTSETNWFIRSGKTVMGDRRHNKTVQRFRLVLDDRGSVTFELKVSNEKGQSQTQEITVGTGSGAPLIEMVDFMVSGMFLTWEVSGDAGALASFIEFTPLYDVAGEYRE